MTKIVKILLDKASDSGTEKRWHVKLDRPHTVKGTNGFYDVDHVIVGVSSLTKTDKHGTFHYEESIVVGTDENATEQPLCMYMVTRSMSLDEILWTIGETATDATNA